MAERIEIVAETRIAASPERIWDVIGSTRRYAEWVVNTLAVTRVDAAVAEEGVSYDERNRIVGPWTARSTWRVLSADPPRRTVHAGSGIPLAHELELECTLTPVGDGTLYQHVISYRPALGWVGLLINRAVAPSLQRDIRATVAKLKALVEAEVSEPRDEDQPDQLGGRRARPGG
jgi:uncharacterized protein YndB with AHSA1/START domain